MHLNRLDYRTEDLASLSYCRVAPTERSLELLLVMHGGRAP
jgi:hypothetical protein